MKVTVAQGSPDTGYECHGNQYVNFRNALQSTATAGARSAVPGVSGVGYALLTGKTNDPGVFAGTSGFNPAGEQDDFATFAAFWNSSDASWTADGTGGYFEF